MRTIAAVFLQPYRYLLPHLPNVHRFVPIVEELPLQRPDKPLDKRLLLRTARMRPLLPYTLLGKIRLHLFHILTAVVVNKHNIIPEPLHYLLYTDLRVPA